MTISSPRLCFYGAGSMAEAIVRGLIDRGLAAPAQISMFNRQNTERLQELQRGYGVQVSSDPGQQQEMLQQADIIFLMMKPKDAAEALKKLGPLLSGSQLVVSVIAGLSIRTIEQLLAKPNPIARTMPNTSSTIGLGATGISFSGTVTEQQQLMVKTMFEAIGLTAIVEEPQLDAVTGVSGSGPAYIYYIMEAMIQGGKELGLSEEEARALTVQTVLGAARMVQQTGEEPQALRKKVTSPNGTTEAALKTLADQQVGPAIVKAVARAAARAGELGLEIERSALS